MTSNSQNEVGSARGNEVPWRPFGAPKRIVLLFVGFFVIAVLPYLLWSQTSRVRYLDINSGATKKTVEVFGVPISSSPMLPPVHEVPGLKAEWRRAGVNHAGAISDGPWGRAAADYRAIGEALEVHGVDDVTRAQVFDVWRGYLHGHVPGYLDFSYASDDGVPVAARVETSDTETLVIFDLRD